MLSIVLLMLDTNCNGHNTQTQVSSVIKETLTTKFFYHIIIFIILIIIIGIINVGHVKIFLSM